MRLQLTNYSVLSEVSYVYSTFAYSFWYREFLLNTTSGALLEFHHIWPGWITALHFVTMQLVSVIP